jgi:hypothetical protein
VPSPLLPRDYELQISSTEWYFVHNKKKKKTLVTDFCVVLHGVYTIGSIMEIKVIRENISKMLQMVCDYCICVKMCFRVCMARTGINSFLVFQGCKKGIKNVSRKKRTGI